MTRAIAVAALAFGPMVAEAWLSRRNERRLRAAGATEPAGDVYAAMQIAYPACFLALALEASLRRAAPGSAGWLAIGALTFAAAKALKYWAIVGLGERWTFRVLVPPGAPLVTSGPYRWLRHPNYLAVVGELVGAALIGGAPLSGAAGTAGFGALMLARIRVEERALHRRAS